MANHYLSTFLLFATLSWTTAYPAHAQQGTWRAYLSYHQPKEIVETGSDMVYVLASGDLYAYNRTDQSIQTFDKTTVLSDCGIAHIAYSNKEKRLVIVYSNGNIDLLEQNSNVINIADYMNKTITGDKTVNAININGSTAYMATRFGIVCIGIGSAAILNTYNLGFSVNYCYVKDQYLYAANSSKGLYRGALTDNLADPTQWTRVGNYIAPVDTTDTELKKTIASLNPGGPRYNNFGYMTVANNRLYTVQGGADYNDCSAAPQVMDLATGDWTIYDDSLRTTLGHAYLNAQSIAVDPNDPDHVWASGRTGLYEYQQGHLKTCYNFTNCPLQSAATVQANNPDYVIVYSVMYDSKGSLWMENGFAPERSLIELTADRQWVTHDQKAFMIENSYSLEYVRHLQTDSRGLFWAVNDNWTKPSLLCYQPSSNSARLYSDFTNTQGTTYSINYCRDVCEDLDHNIWVCTNMGPFYLTPDDINSQSDLFNQPIIPRNDGTNTGDYLLSNVDIKCMTVDAAGRKWFGTAGSGLYCISRNNMTQVYHFTADNSPLLSNNITALTLVPSTGELFIGTENGLCSFMTNDQAAAQGMTSETVRAYPNPVKPGYEGAITITGLSDNADVKITTINGMLIEQGRATGGEYKWYGLNRRQHRVASGIYLVQVATPEGDKGVVCKIAIVN